jgi:hypothetical protein
MLFGIAEAIEAIRKRKILKDKMFSLLKSEYESISNKAENLASKKFRENLDFEKKRNSTCPKCGKTNVTDRIKRQQGSIEGSMDGFHALFLGSVSGSIEGNLDTNEVNKCNDCGHEWKKKSNSYESKEEIIEDHIDHIRYYLQSFYMAEHCKFNKKDLTEKYNNLQEKRDALMKEAENSLWKKDVMNFWEGYSIDLMERLAKEHLSDFTYDYLWKEAFKCKDRLKELGFITLKEKVLQEEP